MARVRLPIIVTTRKFITQDVEDDTTVMDIVEDATITVTNRETLAPQTVYKYETGIETFTEIEMVSNGRGRFEGWVERSLVSIEVTYGDQSYTEEFDAVPAKDGSVDGDWLADGTITDTNLASASVTTAKLGDGAVTDNKVASANKDGNAATPSMRTLGAGANQAAAGNDSRLSDSRTPSGAASGELAGTYPSPTIAAGAVVEAKIGTGAVTAAKLGTGAVTAGKIDTGAVTVDKIGTGAVTADKLGSGAVTLAKINADAKSQAAGTASLRELGTGATQAAPGNDSRFTALISSANEIQEEWIADRQVTSRKLLPSVYQTAGTGTSPEVFNQSTGSGFGINVGSLSFTPPVNSRALIWASWDLVNFSTAAAVELEGYLLKNLSIQEPKAIYTYPGTGGNMRLTVTQTYAINIDTGSTTTVSQWVKCNTSGASGIVYRPNSRLTAILFAR